MIIKSIKIEGFRNIEKETVTFDDRLNLIYGKNASGKTSILESIYFCAFGKSFRSKDTDLIHYNREFCRVEAYFEHNNRMQKIEYAISKMKGKWFKINSKAAKNLNDIVSNIHIVMFSPDDLRLIKDGPMVRRNFLNKELSNLSKTYYCDLSDYHKILKQRNALLKKRVKQTDLEIWDEQLAEKAVAIIKKRRWYLEILNEISKKIHYEISEENEILELKYKNALIDEKTEIDTQGLKDKIKKALDRHYETDRIRGFTSVGPHMDDIEILINEKPSKIFSSQGQQRTAALSIKLAEIDLIKKEYGNYPIVLLDDILSELDLKRQEQIKSVFGKTQILISNAYDIGEGNKIEISDGKVVRTKIENGNG